MESSKSLIHVVRKPVQEREEHVAEAEKGEKHADAVARQHHAGRLLHLLAA